MYLYSGGCAQFADPAVKVARQVQHDVHPDHFSPKRLKPVTLFMIQVKTDPPLRAVFKTDDNLAELIEPGAGTKINLLGLDPEFNNMLPGGYEHRRVKAEIFQYVGDKWWDGFVDVARKKGEKEWRVLLQCVSGMASLDEGRNLTYDPLSTNCYWSHFHHDDKWYKPYRSSYRRDVKMPVPGEKKN